MVQVCMQLRYASDMHACSGYITHFLFHHDEIPRISQDVGSQCQAESPIAVYGRRSTGVCMWFSLWQSVGQKTPDSYDLAHHLLHAQQT